MRRTCGVFDFAFRRNCMIQSMALRRFTWLLILGAFTLSLTACPKKQTVKKTSDQSQDEAANKLTDEEIASQELDIHNKDFVSTDTLGTIYFDYDSPDLSEKARQTLATNVEYLKQNKTAEILVEGHCDERGTVGYNLALGQKRAAQVRKYYVSLGIAPKRIGAISFGKEKAVCKEDTEECWSQNRRAETKVSAPKVGQNGVPPSVDKQ